MTINTCIMLACFIAMIIGVACAIKALARTPNENEIGGTIFIDGDKVRVSFDIEEINSLYKKDYIYMRVESDTSQENQVL